MSFGLGRKKAKCKIIKNECWAVILENFKYVVEKMFEISDVRKSFSNMYRKRIIEDDFYNVDDSTVITN